jgi:FixJ family two-component response regulator
MRDKPIIGVVDDDESVRLALGALLRSVGFDNQAFASGQEFLQAGAADRIDCLIVDLRMKGMSGLELQRALNDAGSTVPVIFISAHGDDDARQRATAAGSIGFFSKPFDEKELLECVRLALERRP